MIKMISRPNIHEFERMVTGLERGLAKNEMAEYWTIDALYDHMINEQIFGFYQEESQYSGAFSIVNTPLKRCMNIFWSGKDPENKVPIDLEECDNFFTACAQFFGCSAITVKGRKGWGKWGESLGYTENSRIFLKEVPHEPSEI